MLRRFVVLGAVLVVSFGLAVGCASSPEEKSGTEATAGEVSYKCATPGCTVKKHADEGAPAPSC